MRNSWCSLRAQLSSAQGFGAANYNIVVTGNTAESADMAFAHAPEASDRPATALLIVLFCIAAVIFLVQISHSWEQRTKRPYDGLSTSSCSSRATDLTEVPRFRHRFPGRRAIATPYSAMLE